MLLLALAGVLPAGAQSPPQIPAARFFGTLTIGGIPAPLGTSVVAESTVSGSLCGSGAVSSAGSYFFDVQPYGGCAAGVVFLVNGQRADQTVQLSALSGSAIPLNLTVSGPFPPPPPFGITVAYQAGWNLVAGSAGTVIADAFGPLYTFQSGDAAYEVLTPGTPLRVGAGYWAYFTAPTTVALPAGSLQSITETLAYGQLVMIGNPFTTSAIVSGAAVVYTYSPSYGYQLSTILQPGQGAWAVSYSGSITLSPATR